jgi:hypothetical protein
MSHEFDNAIHLLLVAFGLIFLAIVISIAVIPLNVAAWVTSLDIPDSIKLFLLDNIFAFTLALIGIPALVIAKITKIL